MEQLLELYKMLLATAKVKADNSGMLSVSYAGKTNPLLLKGKRLALPTREALKTSKEEVTIFHPLYENIMLNSETEVIAKYRKLINTRLDYTVGLLFAKILSLTLSTGEHSKLSPEQAEMLSVLKNATDKTYEVLKKLISEGDGIVSIYCKRSGKVESNPFKQAAIVKFPLYVELSEKREKYYGQTVSNKDRETLLKLYRYVFPNIDTPEYYNKGSNSKIAPCMDALMKSVVTVGTEVNDKSLLFAELFDNEDLVINADWVPAFDDLDKLSNIIRSVPMQGSNLTEEVKAPVGQTVNTTLPVGNGGVATVTSAKEEVSDNGLKLRGTLYTSNSMPPPIQQPVQQVVQPVYQPALQAPVNNTGAVSLSQLYGNSVPQQQFAPMQQQRMAFGQPTGYVPQGMPMQQQQMGLNVPINHLV